KGLSAIRRHDHALLRSSSAETVTEQRRYLVEALAALDSIPGTLPTAPPLNIPALLAYDTEHDPNCLLGHRYLCRGGGLLFIGESGLGKSSAIVQAASTWALGNSFFGITPSRPLKSIIIQAENDIGDMSEQVRGVVNGLDLAGAVESLRERVILVPECSLTGSAFVQFARGLALTHKPDLMFADPLLAYLGADVNEQKNVSAFLRNGLNPVGIQVGCGWVIVHHTSKPSRDPKAQTNIRASALSYFGLGSCELTNWARAILVLREIEEDLYELRATKRGGRAGLRESEAPDAGETNAVYIRHGAHGICWERADRMPTEIESAQQAAEAVLEEIAANESMAYEDILERIEKLRKCKRSTAAKFFGEFLTPSTFKVGRFYRRKPL
ncbi:MAG: AAA family ATPase, partial [Planctomycetota bacterium]